MDRSKYGQKILWAKENMGKRQYGQKPIWAKSNMEKTNMGKSLRLPAGAVRVRVVQEEVTKNGSL